MKLELIYLSAYLLIINGLASIVFWLDKRKAIKHKYRTPEIKLHLYEVLGGVFIILPLLYLIRHKNRKISYYFWTYLIFAGWIALLYYILTIKI
jgi:uncharacterized membrane protein YsdA (DUF1294 family)